MDTNDQGATIEEVLTAAFQAAPRHVQEYLASEKLGAFCNGLGSRYGIHADVLEKLERELTTVLLGITQPKELAYTLPVEVGIPDELVIQIIEEANKNIFVPLRDAARTPGQNTPITATAPHETQWVNVSAASSPQQPPTMQAPIPAPLPRPSTPAYAPTPNPSADSNGIRPSVSAFGATTSAAPSTRSPLETVHEAAEALAEPRKTEVFSAPSVAPASTQSAPPPASFYESRIAPQPSVIRPAAPAVSGTSYTPPVQNEAPVAPAPAVPQSQQAVQTPPQAPPRTPGVDPYREPL